MKNVLGTDLKSCNSKPVTGYFRDGFCRTDESDHGKHVVASVMDRKFFNNRLTVSLTSMLDIAEYPNISGVTGSLSELKAEYSIIQNLYGLIGITSVKGNDSHPDKELYPFNKMEDFSHTRFEIKYFF